MLRLTVLAIAAAAIVLGLYSADLLLALAALCGSCGVVLLLGPVAAASPHVSAPRHAIRVSQARH